MARWTASSGRSTNSIGLVLIGVFKLFKAVLLIAAGIGVIRLLHRDLASTLTHWVHVLRVDPDNRWVHGLLVRIFRVTPQQLRALSLGTFLYAGLYATEGIGLLLRKRWAEYLVIVTTTGFIPIEIYELARHFTAARLGIVVLNVLIVLYLVRTLRKH